MTPDGYGAHVSYDDLRLLKDNNLIAAVLPAHNSHRTQVMNYTVFSPFKTSIKNEINKRTPFVSKEHRSDVYTLCDLLHFIYIKAVTYKNIFNEFRACGLWCLKSQVVDSPVIKVRDITNCANYDNRDYDFTNYKVLVQSYQFVGKYIAAVSIFYGLTEYF